MSTALPARFLERLQSIIPSSQWESVLASFSSERPVCFRINPLRAGTDQVLDEFNELGLQPEPLPWNPYGYCLPTEARSLLTESALFNEGRIYIQGLSSQLAAIILNPQPGETILDLAAAPGGKTLHIAAMMQNHGQLSAVEPVKNRFFKLRANLERGAAIMVKTYLRDGREVGHKVPERFDRVLLDAPCSSEARIRAGKPESWSHWSEKKIKEVARKQKRLLHSAILSLKPGGRLLYSTCSFAPEENEIVIQDVLRKHPEMSVLPVDMPVTNIQPGLPEWSGKTLNPEVVKSVRVVPTKQMDGFFLCLLQKKTGP
ncbi:MAG: RsmB/NOP family class I SAM-dependent RNA methyltransferase [Gammaproteobacteria bacterium]|nr:RsmB/NOP family class I SAM-dependent RNA methyltransferase [Gammaproteobacteria bacterium]